MVGMAEPATVQDADTASADAAAAPSVAAPSTTSSTSSSSSSSPPSSSSPATFSNPVGVIVPPPTLQPLIIRTAQFVQKPGSERERELHSKLFDRVKDSEREKNQKKFAFLFPSSPYHAYFRQQLLTGGSDASTGAAQSTEAASAASAAAAQEAEERSRDAQAEQVRLQQEEAEKSRPKTLEERLQAVLAAAHLTPPAVPPSRDSSFSPPTPLSPSFLFRPPTSYSAADVELVRVTAAYCALQPAFLASLQQRERSNPQFDFLNPVHSLHRHLQQMTAAYQTINEGQSTQPLLALYRRCLADDGFLLQRLVATARLKAESDALEERRVREQEEEEQVMAAVDWQSFVVVASISFTSEEEAWLPEPKQTVEEMEAMLAELAIQEEREREEKERREKERRDRDRPLDDEQLQAEREEQQAVRMQQAATAVVDQSAEPLEVRAAGSAAASAPPAAAAAASVSRLVTCVVCGDTIAAEELEAHLRIELLDPRWKEQKQQLMDRQRESSLVSGKGLSDNLKRLDRKRREADRERSKEEEERQRRDDARLLGLRTQHDQPTSPPRSAAAALPLPPLPPPPPAPPQPAANAGSAPGAAVSSSEASLEPPAKRPRPLSPTPLPLATAALPTVSSFAAAPAASHPAPLPPPALPQPPATAPPSALPAAAAPSSAPAGDAAAAIAPVPAAPAGRPQPAFVPEALWLSAHPLPVTLRLHLLPDKSLPSHVHGQVMELPMLLTDSVDAVKERLVARLAPAPLQPAHLQLQLRVSSHFLKNGSSLAAYNLYDGAELNVKGREKGGKRK